MADATSAIVNCVDRNRVNSASMEMQVAFIELPSRGRPC